MSTATVCAKRLECVRLAGAVGRVKRSKAGASSPHSKRFAPSKAAGEFTAGSFSVFDAGAADLICL
jgi:hypothetical protein